VSIRFGLYDALSGACDLMNWLQSCCFRRGHYSGLDHAERERIGYMIKDLLNVGRARYLAKHGFEVELVYYVDRATSLENCAIVAKAK